ncbi:nucleotidyltransferase family protein [candidate division KSB1 bacterium]|nr:nucleotidyltransferase family protein [candidate division KSB1 bacterium]
MKTLSELKNDLSRHKPSLEKKYSVESLAIFGSYARGTASENSDLDILVQFKKPIGLDFATLAEELEPLLQMKVDLVSVNAIKPKMMDYVKENLIYV